VQQDKIDCDSAAKRVSHQVGAVNFEVIEQAEEVIGNAIGLLRSRRFPEWPDVVAHDAESGGERRDLPIPAAAIHERAVEKDNRRSRARGVVDDLAARHRQARGLHPRERRVAGLIEEDACSQRDDG
jgi:hypothetical protein